MAPWPSARDLGTKKVLKDLERERIEKKIAVARADIVIAKIRGDMCRDFLCDAERYLESGQINPGNICELIDRYYKGYNPQLLRSALTALTRVNSQAMADRIINRIDAIHRLHGRANCNVDVARLTHPAGG